MKDIIYSRENVKQHLQERNGTKSDPPRKKYITTDNNKMELRDLLVKIRYLSKQK